MGQREPEQLELDAARGWGGFPPLERLTSHWLFTNFILTCIIINAIALGIDTNFGDEFWMHAYIENLDKVFLAIFTIELFLEFLATGPKRYFRNGWNLFDIFVVSISYLSVPGISALRTLRVLRVLRLVSAVPQMRRVVEALLGAMPGIVATTAILAIVFYIGAVMATTLFPGQPGFTNLGQSALTLFQLTQFDGWGDTVNGLQEAGFGFAWLFLMVFVIIAAFAVLNLFIGVIVDAVQETRAAQTDELIQEVGQEVDEIEEDVEGLAAEQQRSADKQDIILQELRSLRAELAALKAGQGGGGGPA